MSSPSAAAILLYSSCMLARSFMIMSRSRFASSTSARTVSMLESVLNCIATMVRIKAYRSSFSVSSTTTPSRRCSACRDKHLVWATPAALDPASVFSVVNLVIAMVLVGRPSLEL
ncbi:unnamed protein product [Linum trigynum]|uniref:Secreted protein n=1 Tax=Linum trigynum TaxID=586398 RepID=A0AAV2DY35_9ROSI